MKLKWNIEYDFYHNYMNSYIRFAIPLEDGRVVYMCERFERGSAEIDAHIVLLDTQKFINIWRHMPDTDQYQGIQKGNKSIWLSPKTNRYIAMTNSHFADGKNNPVPLAWLNCSNLADGFYWTNGMTRTMWLLSYNAKFIPILTIGKQSAKTLSVFVGVKYTHNHHTLADIMTIARQKVPFYF
ncbi:MAG: hypothetical protein IJR44_06525 [Neisseriaceae bacterium]|nr:hypothetical protein [Neisseriaceae bacterium]